MSTPKLLQEGPAFTGPNQQVRMICISCCAETSGAALPKVPKPGFGQSPDHGWEGFLTRRQTFGDTCWDGFLTYHANNYTRPCKNLQSIWFGIKKAGINGLVSLQTRFICF